MKKLIPILIFISAYSTFSPAGVESVGKGGGFAEMQAYAMDRKLPLLLDQCLTTGNFCELSLPEMTVVSDFLKFLKNSKPELLQINETCVEPYFHSEANGFYSVDACQLYTQSQGDFGPLPLPNRNISQLVIEARLRSLPTVLTEDVIHSLSEKLSVGFQFEDRQSIVPVKGFQFRLHLWSLATLGSQSFSVTVETYKNSWDITQQLHKTFKCSAPNFEFKLNDFYFLESQVGATGKSQIQWTCGTQQWQADLYMDLSFQGEELKDASFSLFQKEQI